MSCLHITSPHHTIRIKKTCDGFELDVAITLSDLIPSGPTSERPANPVEGPPSMRYNTDDHLFEFWNGTEWTCGCGDDGGGGTPTLGNITNFTSTAGDETVGLNWDDLANAEDYVLLRNTSNTLTGATTIYSGTASNYTDNAVVNGTHYYYFVKGTALGYNDSPYATTNATPAAVITQLGTPQNFEATPGNTIIDLDWDDVTNATSYTLLRNTTNSTIGATTIFTGGTSAYSDTGRTNGVTYYYFVKATASGYTDSAYASTSGVPVGAPTQLDTPAGFVVTPADGTINLTWGAVPNATNYLAYVNTVNTFSGATLFASTGTPAAISSGLTNGTTYYYFVVATASGYIDSNPGSTSGVPNATTFTATVGHSATDPFVDTSTAPAFTTLRTVTPAVGANIVVQLNDFPFEYFVMEYDDTEPDVTAFFDTVLHNGPIPDGFEWRPIFSVGGKKYLTTYNPAAFDSTPATVSFTH